MSEEKYLKIAEASKQFDVSRTHIYNRVKAGKIRTIGEDGTLQVNEMDVHNYVLGLKRRVKKSKKQRKGKVVRNELNSLPKGGVVTREISIHINPRQVFVTILGVVVGYIIYTLIF